VLSVRATVGCELGVWGCSVVTRLIDRARDSIKRDQEIGVAE